MLTSKIDLLGFSVEETKGLPAFSSFSLLDQYIVGSQLELVAKVENKVNPSCPGSSDGVIIIGASGGSGQYQYSWSHSTSLDLSYATSLSAGNYTVEVTDLESGELKLLEVTLDSPQEMQLALSSLIYPGCDGEFSGEVRLDISGGMPPFKAVGFVSEWENGQLIIRDLASGSYNFLISDAKDCTKTFCKDISNAEPLEVEFFQTSPACSDEFSGELRVQVSGGIAPYTVIWEDGTEGLELTDIPVGNHLVTVTDSNFCTNIFTGEVMPGIPEVRMPTGFDPSEGVYEPISNCPISYNLMIFTDWGELIFQDSTGWDGSFSGKLVTGNYAYYISYTFQDSEGMVFKEQRGGFTLIQ